MRRSFKHIVSSQFRSAVFGIAAAGLLFACVPAVAQAQRAGTFKPSKTPDRIDAFEGDARLHSFRNQRLSGDYCFQFQLIHKPRRGANVYYEGTLWGSWSATGPVSRVALQPVVREGDVQLPVPRVELIVQNGSHPAVWSRQGAEAGFARMEGAALFQPILPEVLFRPFDLQMPYVYWQDYLYEGPDRIGRAGAVQVFRMYPPEGSAANRNWIEAVRIALDDTYNALRRAEVVGRDAEVGSIFEARSFAKVQDQWIVREVSLKDTQTKDSTTFRVKSAAVGIDLNPSIFDPVSKIMLPILESTLFKDL